MMLMQTQITVKAFLFLSHLLLYLDVQTPLLKTTTHLLLKTMGLVRLPLVVQTHLPTTMMQLLLKTMGLVRLVVVS